MCDIALSIVLGSRSRADRMECHQFQKFKKCMHFSIKVRALLQIVRALLQKVRALLQLCVHFYKNTEDCEVFILSK